MFELSQEKLIMYSDDRSVKLTTHRIIQEEKRKRHQIMLEDYENYEIRTAHIGFYKPITIFFLVVSILLLVRRVDEYFAYSERDFLKFMSRSIVLFISIILLGISYHFYLISRRYYVRLNGKFDSIEFRVIRPGNSSVQNFLNTIILQSKRVKSEETV